MSQRDGDQRSRKGGNSPLRDGTGLPRSSRGRTAAQQRDEADRPQMQPMFPRGVRGGSLSRRRWANKRKME